MNAIYFLAVKWFLVIPTNLFHVAMWFLVIQPGWCINFVVLINRTAFCLGEFWWIQSSFLLSENNRQNCILPCLVISCTAPLPDGRYSAAYNAIWYKALQLQRAAPFPRYFPQNPILRTSLHSSVSIPQYHMSVSTSWMSIHSMCSIFP